VFPDKPSIAVLPFANMSGDVEQEYFADGISEDIITALSKLSQLFVIARNSSFTFKGKNVHVREVSKDLGVRYVLEGSVRKSGNRVRITSQLIDATTGGHLWAERFDRDLTDIFAVQDDVTRQIVAALEVNLAQGDRKLLTTEHTDNMEAFDCFLRGRELWWRHAKEPNSQARGLLLRAIELDPNFTPAYAFLAGAHVIDYVSQWTSSPSQSLELAQEAATRAAALDERNPQIQWVLSFVNLYKRRYDEALRAAENSIAFNPNFAEGHNALGVILHYVGRSEEALPCLNARSRWTLCVQVCGCTSRGRCTFNWGDTKRPSPSSRDGLSATPRPTPRAYFWPRATARWDVPTKLARNGGRRCASTPTIP
jgi:adenylate cyclase